MKLSALPSTSYASSRLQPSASSASTGSVSQAHTPQADAQRSGDRRSLTGSVFMVGGILLIAYFSAYLERNATLFKILINPSNCERSISMVKGHLNSVDPKKFKGFSASVQTEVARESSIASEILEEITKKCEKKPSPVK